jgi:hypothetical protein
MRSATVFEKKSEFNTPVPEQKSKISPEKPSVLSPEKFDTSKIIEKSPEPFNRSQSEADVLFDTKKLLAPTGDPNIISPAKTDERARFSI